MASNDSSDTRTPIQTAGRWGIRAAIIVKHLFIAFDRTAQIIATSGNMSIMDALKAIFHEFKTQYTHLRARLNTVDRNSSASDSPSKQTERQQ